MIKGVTKDDEAMARKIVSLLKRGVVKFERSSEEPTLFFKVQFPDKTKFHDEKRDPYTGFCSAHPRSNFKIETDGVIKYGRAEATLTVPCKPYSISGYNYIILFHHWPDKKFPERDEYYQTIITKRYQVKLLVQSFAGLSIG